MDSGTVAETSRQVPRDSAEFRRLMTSIVESSDDAIYGKDLNGIITSWNASAERVYGFSAEEVLGHSVSMLVPGELKNDLREILDGLREGKGVQHYETIRVAKGGRRIPVSLTISPIRDEGGTIIGASTIARDISQRRVDERRWRMLAEVGDAVSGVLDVDKMLQLLAELAVKDLADYCVTYRLRDEVIERIGTAHADPAQLPVLRRLTEMAPLHLSDNHGVGTVLRTGAGSLVRNVSIKDFEAETAPEMLKIIRALHPISSMILPLGARGRTVGAIAFVTTPLSERHYTEADLAFGKEVADRAALALDNASLYQAAQEELLRREAAESSLQRRYEELRVLYQMTDAVGRASGLDEIYEQVLDGFNQALGVRRAAVALFDGDEVLRFKAWRGLSDDYRAMVESFIPWSPQTRNPLPIVIPDIAAASQLPRALTEKILAEGIMGVAFFPLVFRSQLLGKVMLYFDTPRTLDADEVELARTIGRTVGFAITKARDEHSVRDAKESAERASEAKSQFLGIMSHELRTPLNAVLGYSDLLLLETRGPLSDGQREQVERIRGSALHQLGLVDELLTYTRLEAGRDDARLVETDARRVIADVVELIRPQVEGKGLRLRTIMPETPLIVFTDPAKLRQIALNLAGNAAKYTETGGVTIRATVEVEDCFVLEVLDTGTGIPEDKLEFIFEPFAQVDQSRTRQAGGTGLGLAIVRQFASLLGGDVIVTSDVGKGSAFVLRLPGVVRRREETAHRGEDTAD